MTTYESKSIGWWIFVLAGAIAVFGGAVASGVGIDAGDGSGLAIGGVVIAVALLVANFGVLSVRVDREGIAWRFGPGPIGRRIALERVRGVETIRTPWYWGWGIRWTKRGWLWRSTGLDTVWLELDGGRSIGVGTQDPDGLARAIRRRVDGAE